MTKHKDNPWFISTDFNAKSRVWGQDEQDPRGTELLELILRHQLDILNNPNSIPTFSAKIGTSWVDIALATPSDKWIYQCEVRDEITASDHNLY